LLPSRSPFELADNCAHSTSRTSRARCAAPLELDVLDHPRPRPSCSPALAEPQCLAGGADSDGSNIRLADSLHAAVWVIRPPVGESGLHRPTIHPAVALNNAGRQASLAAVDARIHYRFNGTAPPEGCCPKEGGQHQLPPGPVTSGINYDSIKVESIENTRDMAYDLDPSS